jgi:hypothetical protein
MKTSTVVFIGISIPIVLAGSAYLVKESMRKTPYQEQVQEVVIEKKPQIKEPSE